MSTKFELPEICQSALVELLVDEVDKVILLRKREDHAVYRIRAKTGNFVLKCFQTPPLPKEIKVYVLLQKYGVPTLPCCAMTENAILLEDLDFSETWRRAGEDDIKSSSTGIAVAEWYQRLHAVGLEVLMNAEENLDHLEAWVDAINQNELKEVDHRLEIKNSRGWKLAISHCEELKNKYRSFPQTFNYNDFAAENLALSCTRQENLQAIIYDYDQFSIGTIYSDWRNVVYSLQGEAREAFMDTYGEVSEIERRLDDVLSILHGLIIAVARDKFPKWALPLRNSIENGELERKISTALEIV
jgi:hypothetical protein